MSGERLAFERLELLSLPGLERGGFTLDGLSSGVTVIHGPNASGKSSTGRAAEQLLWPSIGAGERRRLRGTLTLDGDRWEVELDHDRRDWWRDGEHADGPSLPPSHHADRYGLALHDLLGLDDAEADSDEGGFARRVAEEAAGGFDLATARARIGAKERPSRPARILQEYERARKAVDEIERRQRSLRSEAIRLASLREELKETREAAARLEMVRAAVLWHESLRALDEERRRLDPFPSELDRLGGDEPLRLERLEEEVQEAERDLETRRAKAATARRRRDAAGLPAGGVPRAILDTLNGWTDRLRELEREAARELLELEQVRERRARLRGALGDAAEGEDVDERLEGFGRSEWEGLVRLARRAETKRAEAERIEQMERWIGAGEESLEPAAEEDRPDVDRLRDGVRLLRRWLATPVPGWTSLGPALAGALLLIAFGVAVAAEMLEPPPEWPAVLPWIVVAVGAGLLLWTGFARHAGLRRRRDLADEDTATGLEPPPRWAETPVRVTLEAREHSFDRRRLESEKAALRPGLASERSTVEAEQEEIEADRRHLVRALGAAPFLGEDVEPAPLAAFVDALVRWREAHLEVGGREAACGRLERERARLLSEINACLDGFDMGPVSDGGAAASAGQELGRRGEEHRQALAELEALEGPEGEIATAEQRLARRRESVEELFRSAGLDPGDRGGLDRLVRLRPDYIELRDRVERLSWELDRRRDDLPTGAAGEALRKADPDDLAAERDELERVAAREAELNDGIVELETLVGEAERGDRLQAALGELRDAEAALRAAREEEADALVAWELVAWVRRSVARRHQPAVLRGTRALFARFTRGRYELLEPDGDPPEFRARESDTGRVRRLRELSAGTRVQLLLAVRLAFVEHQERGPRLPLVLDEALANSDEWAAKAVIDTLVEVSRSGRQVIYFTAQHDEVAKWQAALGEHDDPPPSVVIDLERVRRAEEAAERPWLDLSTVRPGVPSPDGMTRAEYARALDVPGIDPREEVGAVHLWYLIDDVHALHGVLSRGISRWGDLETLLDTGAGSGLLGPEGERHHRAAVATARARCIDAISRLWRQGRGRPVDRGVLRQSEAVSDTFIDEVSELAGELDGDPARLLEALRARKVSRFQTTKIEQLEEYLITEGYLDERPRLDDEEIRTRVLAALASEVEAGALTVEEIEEFLARMPD